MSQEENKLKNYTSFNFNGQEMNQEEVNALIADISQSVNGLLGNLSGQLENVLKGASLNVNQVPALSPTTLKTQVQQLMPRVETSNQNGVFGITLNGEPLIELNLLKILNK